MSCRAAPKPTPVLLQLIQSGVIVQRPDQVADSVSCWRVTRPLTLRGLPVSGVCAFDEEPTPQALRMGLYRRGPGTSPGTQLAVLTPLHPGEARQWVASSKIGRPRVGENPEYRDVPGKSEVSCGMFR